MEVDATVQHERAVEFDFHTGDELFPKTFEYVTVEGGTRTTERRPLFGDLVDAVQWSRLGV